MAIIPPQPSQNSNFISNQVITIKDFKTIFLYGVPLTNKLGDVVSDDSIQFHLDSAVSWLEQELEVSIAEKQYDEERHDYVWSEYLNWGFIHLYHMPITEIVKINIEYPDTGQSTSFPLAWAQMDMEGRSGVLQIVPGVGSANSFIIGQGSTLLPMIFKTQSYLPALFKITYKAGFKNNKVPANVLSVIGKKAAIDLLTQVGDQILTPGISSTSIGIDGLSESVSSPFNAGMGVFGGRITQYSKDLLAELSQLRQYYRGIRMTVA